MLAREAAGSDLNCLIGSTDLTGPRRTKSSKAGGHSLNYLSLQPDP
jgi:hypothetical protein